MNTKITDVQSKYDRFLAEARKDARKEIEGIERQEIKSDPKLASKEVKPAPKSIPKSAPMKNPFPSSKKLSCKYCGKELSPNGLFQHEKHCQENPINIAKREMDAKKEEVKIDVTAVKPPNKFWNWANRSNKRRDFRFPPRHSTILLFPRYWLRQREQTLLHESNGPKSRG